MKCSKNKSLEAQLLLKHPIYFFISGKFSPICWCFFIYTFFFFFFGSEEYSRSPSFQYKSTSISGAMLLKNVHVTFDKTYVFFFFCLNILSNN